MIAAVCRWLGAVLGPLSIALAVGGGAQAVEFKTITIKVGYGPGGGFDQSSRLVARHLGRFLPGNPDIVVQNVPGGGSLKLTKMMLGSEPADGSVIASVSEGIPLAPILDPDNAGFDPLAIQWIGALAKEPSICAVSKSTGIDTIDKFLAGDLLLGATARSSHGYLMSALVKNGLKAKFTIVTGFDGTAEVGLAMERGEVAGYCGVSYYNVSDRLDRVNVIGTFGEGRLREMPNVPRFSDRISDPVLRNAAQLVESTRAFHLPLLVPPATPAETVETLRHAYVEMTKDPAFLADAAKLSDLVVDVTTGEEIHALIERDFALGPAVFEVARDLVK